MALNTEAIRPTTIQAPTLKWEHGGCYSSWCDTGWYASPAVADLDGDGSMEVIAGSYTLFILNGENGETLDSINTPGDRIWPGVVVADLDGDGDNEIVIAQGGGYLYVFDHSLNVLWWKQPASRELRGLSVFDLDADGTLEIIVTGAVLSKVNTWVYEHNGSLRSGWPQLNSDSGYAYGVFNDNASIGDIDHDGIGEIVVPSDVHYICAYEPDGKHILAHAMYGGKYWGQVGVWEDPAPELLGWGKCDGTRSESYRTNFAHGPASIADMNGDGLVEVVATGNVYECPGGTGEYNGVYVFNADRSRFNASGYDWRNPPTDTGAPLSESYNVIESAQPNPVLADLDGNGELEILYASYDGRVHAFWLDKTEHHNWPYDVYNGGVYYRFASEPTIADLDNDGFAEVIFASWVQKGSDQTGKLHILDYQGDPIHEINLPNTFGSPDWNGALAAPTLANIDADPDLEVVLNTAHSGFVAYDLPGTAHARILWGTGRGNYQRTGSYLTGSLQNSSVSVHPLAPNPGDILYYTIVLTNPGPTLPSVQLTSTLPSGVIYQADLSTTSGSASESGGVITWKGKVSAVDPVRITFSARVDASITEPTFLVNAVLIDNGLGFQLQFIATAIVNGYALYLPVLQRH
ncbi:FG-GAP-like repeat-containing protein [Chloroflexota bacterium]